MADRRSFLQRALGFGAALLTAPAASGVSQLHTPSTTRRKPAPRSAPVVTTEVGDMPFTLDGGVKVFHLIAQVVRQQIAPNKTLDLWGFNGSSPGPTFQVTEGDRVRIVFENQLPEPCSIHWHGFEAPIRFDGMPGISQAPTLPGERFIYEFDIHQTGTYFYHSHMAMQEMAGMLGAFIMHPREPYLPHCDKDFVLHFQEYAVLPNNTVPNTMNMEFNWLLINGRAGPAATPLIVRLGDRVRLRLINLGMDHHPIHLHGNTFHITGTEGGRIPEAAWWPGNTALVGVAQARDVEFEARNPGDWMLHCHLPHHMMNQMSSQAGPLTRTGMGRMPASASMNTGMGMPTQGSPGGQEYGAAIGRGMGASSNGETPMSNSPLRTPPGSEAMADMEHMMQSGEPVLGGDQMRNMMAMDMTPATMQQQAQSIAPNAASVPNFPQDAYMEGPMMNMEHTGMLDKPENDGLRAGWSSSMQGMMTFVRVLPPDEYDAVIAKMRAARRANDPYASLLGTQGEQR